MRGVIDPWTLGFIISIFGGVTGLIVHPPGENNTTDPAIEYKQTGKTEPLETKHYTAIYE